MCETPEVYVHERPKARKKHTCCECRGVIQPGELYHRHRGVWDGRGCSFRVCNDCEAIRKEMDEGLPCDEWTPFGGVAVRPCGSRVNVRLSLFCAVNAHKRRLYATCSM